MSGSPKRKVFEQCIKPVIIDVVETLALTNKSAYILSITELEGNTNQQLPQKTTFTDILEKVAKPKWRLADHLPDSRMENGQKG